MEQNEKIEYLEQQIHNIYLEINKLSKFIERIGELIKICPKCKDNIMTLNGEAIWPPTYKCNKCDVSSNVKIIVKKENNEEKNEPYNIDLFN